MTVECLESIVQKSYAMSWVQEEVAESYNNKNFHSFTDIDILESRIEIWPRLLTGLGWMLQSNIFKFCRESNLNILDCRLIRVDLVLLLSNLVN